MGLDSDMAEVDALEPEDKVRKLNPGTPNLAKDAGELLE